MSTKQQTDIWDEEAEGVTGSQRSEKHGSESQGAKTECVASTHQDIECDSEDCGETPERAVNTQRDGTRNPEGRGGEADEEEVKTFHEFDRNWTHFPVFCLTKPTDEYWNEFIQHAQDTPWTQICYDTPPTRKNVLESIESNLDKEGPWPFDDFTIDEVYDFHKQYTSPVDDSTNIEPFTYFTFLAIDDECVDPVDPNAGFSVMVCSDAPDYDDPDGETTLKKMRLPIETAIWSLIPLEELTITPSEALNPISDALCCIPAPTHKQVSKPPDEMFTVASFAEARMFKREAILHREVALKPSYAQRMMDDERRTQLFKCSLKEAKVTAHLYREVEELSRSRGATFRVKPNTKRPRSEVREGANDGDEGEEGENHGEEDSVLNHKRSRSEDEDDKRLEKPDAESAEGKRVRRE